MIDRESADHQEILVGADRAMYDAKAAGRDRVAPLAT
jgi:PleD family two-component response regulator